MPCSGVANRHHTRHHACSAGEGLSAAALLLVRCKAHPGLSVIAESAHPNCRATGRNHIRCKVNHGFKWAAGMADGLLFKRLPYDLREPSPTPCMPMSGL